MSEFDLNPRQRPPATSALFILLTALIGFYLIGPAIGFLLAIPFFEGSLPDFALKLTHPLLYPAIKIPFLIMQGSATFFGLIVGPSLYWFWFEKRNVFDFARRKSTPFPMLALTAILVIVFMAPNSVIIDWNAHISLPEFLKDFENTARSLEDRAEQLTKFFTTIGSAGEFILIFFIVAIIPALGEELVFRGMLQPQLQRATNNAHIAIWISAILFSIMHMQFFGFVPRVLLGALFGYLYFWSGNLIVPVFAHFINNGFSIVMLYLQQLGKVNLDVESTEAAPWPVVITGSILTFGLLVYLKKVFERNPTSS